MGGEEEKGEEEGRIKSVREIMFSRIGRVERSRHGGTVLFLGKSFAVALLIIWLIQYLCQAQVCTLDIPLYQIPEKAQKMLLSEDPLIKWCCPLDERNDLSFTLRLLPSQRNSTLENVTQIQVGEIEKLPVPDNLELKESTEDLAIRHYQDISDSKDCHNIKMVITEPVCYVHTQAVSEVHEDKTPDVFGIYFVLSVGFLLLCFMFITIYKIFYRLWGGKREGTYTVT